LSITDAMITPLTMPSINAAIASGATQVGS
jgi:hypothetical protein